MIKPRFILVTFPAQGHINPALQLAKRLIRTYHCEVTFVTTIFAHRRMAKDNNDKENDHSAPLLSNDLSFAPFSDGYDQGLEPDKNFDDYNSELRHRSSQAVADLVGAAIKEGRPYSCIVYTLLLPWVADVAAEHKIPAAILWVQPATVFDIFYYYFHGYKDTILENSENPNFALSFPGLPPLTILDLPSFMNSSSPYSFLIKFFQAQFEKLEEESDPKILVNTFDELEHEALRSVGRKMRLIGIGPLIPSAFSDEKDLSDTSFGGDLFRCPNDDYIEWLNSKEKTTVVYLSFGSFAVLSKPQMEEIAKGLVEFGRPFLWVIREKEKNDNGKVQNDKDDDEELSCREELEKLGKIVTWCTQVEVLSNESLGCFVSHCGWNSTLESLVSGVPMVAFPQWVDQKTNAKLIEDVWKTGVRVKSNEEGIVGAEEIKRCLELLMGGKENGEESLVERGEAIRRNAKKWKDLAREAVMEGGSSDRNFKAFVNEVIGGGVSSSES